MGNKIPKSWLDDPEWEVLRRKAENRPIPKDLKKKVADQRPKPSSNREIPRASAGKAVSDKEVVVNLKLALPKIKPPNLKRLFSIHRKKILLGGTMVLSTALVFGAYSFYTARKKAEEAKKPVAPEEQAKESFTPLVPLQGLTDQTGKQVAQPEFKYDPEKKVLGYQSAYNEAQITISQQALPEQLKTHPGQLEGIARSVNATLPIETQKGKAYLATDEEFKTQIAVFATSDVLVFIRSNKELDNDEWTFYINQLIPRN